VPKAVLLKQPPKFDFGDNKSLVDGVDIAKIKEAIRKLNLEYRRVDEVDIYNIISYLEFSKKENM
jgi:hypothetical protein